MDYENIKKLIDDLGSSKLTSLDIDFPDGTKISMKKEYNVNSNSNEKSNEKSNETTVVKQEAELINNVINNEVESAENEDMYEYVKSPMVGTFYSKPSPDEKCFIEVGDVIKKGTTTCIIEAMKLMNEIESEFEGTVVEILKKDGDPVEYGEKLIKLQR